MENKINIAELLKDCPQGMELYSPIFGEVYLDEIRPHLAIVVTTNKEQGDFKEEFLYDGRYGMNGECMLFPSKNKTTWEGFQRPFKDGDVVFYDNCVSIFKEWGDETLFRNYVKVDISGGQLTLCARTSSFGKGIKREARLATEEEKQKLFDAIKVNGYKWNPDTKTLEKLPKFKVGDRVKHISACTVGIVVKVADKGYHIDYPKGEGVCYVSFTLEKDYELAPNKFDITTLKPFDKVLMRSSNAREWVGTFYSHYSNNKFYGCGMCCDQCIPYEHNEHLRGTTNDCDDFYKTW